MTNHTYQGTRILKPSPFGGHYVEGTPVTVDGEPLPMSDLARRKSPTGYEWGYGGSGPSALAHSILTYEFGEQVADRHFQEFKRDIVGAFPRDQGGSEWTLTSAEIRAWLHSRNLLRAIAAEIEGHA
jgi:hypothetical protein